MKRWEIKITRSSLSPSVWRAHLVAAVSVSDGRTQTLPQSCQTQTGRCHGKGLCKKALGKPRSKQEEWARQAQLCRALGHCSKWQEEKRPVSEPIHSHWQDFLRQREQSLEVTTSLGQNSWFLGELKQAESSTKTLKSPALTANQIYLVTSASFELLFLTESRICQKPWMLWLYTGD